MLHRRHPHQRRLLRTRLVVLASQWSAFSLPVALFFGELFPGAPMLEGQYVLKDAVPASAGLVIGAKALGAPSPMPPRLETPYEPANTLMVMRDDPLRLPTPAVCSKRWLCPSVVAMGQVAVNPPSMTILVPVIYSESSGATNKSENCDVVFCPSRVMTRPGLLLGFRWGQAVASSRSRRPCRQPRLPRRSVQSPSEAHDTHQCARPSLERSSSVSAVILA